MPRIALRSPRDPERVVTSFIAAAAAAVLLLANGAGIIATRPAAAAPERAPTPVVARAAALTDGHREPIDAHTLYATASWNLPVYSAVLVAQRATEYFADAQARAASVATIANPSH